MPGNNEQTPLLRSEAAESGMQNNARDTSSDEVHQAKRRRWVSLIVSLFIIVAFVVILILAGGKSTPAAPLDHRILDLTLEFSRRSVGSWQEERQWRQAEHCSASLHNPCLCPRSFRASM